MLKDLTLNVQGEQTISSREIAELTGKEHGDIIRDCEELNECYSKLAINYAKEGVDTSKDEEYERHKRKQYNYIKDSAIDTIYNYFNNSKNKYPKIIKVTNNNQPIYYLTKTQTYDLLTGYPFELRVKLIRHWEELGEDRINREQGIRVSEPTEEEKEALKVRLREAEGRLLEAKKKCFGIITESN